MNVRSREFVLLDHVGCCGSLCVMYVWWRLEERAERRESRRGEKKSRRRKQGRRESRRGEKGEGTGKRRRGEERRGKKSRARAETIPIPLAHDSIIKNLVK